MIDAHLHLGHGGRTLEDLIAHINFHNVSQAVVLPIEDLERDVLYSTEEVLNAAEKYPERIIPFCHVDPRGENPLRRIEDYATAVLSLLTFSKENRFTLATEPTVSTTTSS